MCAFDFLAFMMAINTNECWSVIVEKCAEGRQKSCHTIMKFYENFKYKPK